MNNGYRSIAGIFILLGLLGFADSAYLTLNHYLGTVPACSIGGCEEVLTSSYAVVAGVPVALLGALYYLALFFLSLLSVRSQDSRFLSFAAVLAIFGFTASLWFVYLQVFVIEAICLYCLVSAAISTILAFCGTYYLLQRKGA